MSYNQNFNFNNGNISQVPQFQPINQRVSSEKKLFTAWLLLALSPFALFIIILAICIVALLASGGSAEDAITVPSMVLVALASISNIAALVIAIVGRVKYPYYKPLKVAFWIEMGVVILIAISMIFSMISMFVLCGSCVTFCE